MVAADCTRSVRVIWPVVAIVNTKSFPRFYLHTAFCHSTFLFNSSSCETSIPITPLCYHKWFSIETEWNATVFVDSWIKLGLHVVAECHCTILRAPFVQVFRVCNNSDFNIVFLFFRISELLYPQIELRIVTSRSYNLYSNRIFFLRLFNYRFGNDGAIRCDIRSGVQTPSESSSLRVLLPWINIYWHHDANNAEKRLIYIYYRATTSVGMW